MPTVDITVSWGKLAAEESENLPRCAEPVEELARVWCIVPEVPDDSWGVVVIPMTLRDLAQRFGVTPDSVRWHLDQR